MKEDLEALIQESDARNCNKIQITKETQTMTLTKLRGEYNISLTRREIEVIALLCQGFTSKEIANMLHISIKTEETHRSSIRRKLGVNTTVKVILWALGNPEIDTKGVAIRCNQEKQNEI